MGQRTPSNALVFLGAINDLLRSGHTSDDDFNDLWSEFVADPDPDAVTTLLRDRRFAKAARKFFEANGRIDPLQVLATLARDYGVEP